MEHLLLMALLVRDRQRHLIDEAEGRRVRAERRQPIAPRSRRPFRGHRAWVAGATPIRCPRSQSVKRWRPLKSRMRIDRRPVVMSPWSRRTASALATVSRDDATSPARSFCVSPSATSTPSSTGPASALRKLDQGSCDTMQRVVRAGIPVTDARLAQTAGELLQQRRATLG